MQNEFFCKIRVQPALYTEYRCRHYLITFVFALFSTNTNDSSFLAVSSSQVDRPHGSSVSMGQPSPKCELQVAQIKELLPPLIIILHENQISRQNSLLMFTKYILLFTIIYRVVNVSEHIIYISINVIVFSYLLSSKGLFR